LAFTAVAISVLVVRYAPPNEMPMEVALAGTPESITSYSEDSPQDENSEDSFGNGNKKEWSYVNC
jgi:solute carrier family 7 (cationic amino acid transporter), member 1